MSNLDLRSLPNLRTQDIVAKVAAVSLNDTIRVLNSLVLVLPELDEPGCASRIRKMLADDSIHEKPTMAEGKACNLAYSLLRRLYGAERLLTVQQRTNAKTN